MSLNFGNVRNERIYKLERKLERANEKLAAINPLRNLSQFFKTESDIEKLTKELQIQNAYKQMENDNG